MATVASLQVRIGGDIKDLEKALSRASRKMQDAGKKMSSIGQTLTTRITAPLAALGGLSIKTAADFEKLRQSMNVLNGSVEEGARNFERLKEFSAGTPFQLQDLAKAQNTLQGFSLSADDAFSSISMIGDIAAVTGGDMQAISVAFGQAAAEGRLMTQDIRQLVNQGVPAVQMLADTMGVATSEVFDLASKGEISFEILQQAFRDATSEGGMFANGMKEQAGTISGLFSTLKDNVSIALAELGETIVETLSLREVIPAFTKRIQQMVKWFQSLSNRTRGLMVKIVAAIGLVGPALVGLGATFTTIGIAISALTSPIGLVVAALAGLAAGIVYVADNWDAIVERVSDISWWRNALIDMVQFFIEINPFSWIIKAYNALARHFEMTEIPNPLQSLADSLDSLKTETKEYEHQFGSFTDAVVNGIKKVSGVDIGSIFTPIADQTDLAKQRIEEFGKGIQSRALPAAKQIEGTLRKAAGSTDSLGAALGKTSNALDKTSNAFEHLKDTGEAMDAAVTQAFMDIANQSIKSLGDVVRVTVNTARQIIAAEIAKGIAAAVRGALTNVPFPLNIAAAASAGAGAAALFSAAVPRLANGGLAFGPTMAVVGDNPGARTDPEVIAPLSKLKGMGGIDERTLVSALNQLTWKIRGEDIHVAGVRGGYTFDR